MLMHIGREELDQRKIGDQFLSINKNSYHFRRLNCLKREKEKREKVDVGGNMRY